MFGAGLKPTDRDHGKNTNPATGHCHRDRYQGLGNTLTGKTNADVVSVGVGYKS